MKIISGKKGGGWGVYFPILGQTWGMIGRSSFIKNAIQTVLFSKMVFEWQSLFFGLDKVSFLSKNYLEILVYYPRLFTV